MAKFKNNNNEEIKFWLRTAVAMVVMCGGLIGWFGSISKKNAKETLQKYEQERAKNDTINIDSLVNQHMR